MMNEDKDNSLDARFCERLDNEITGFRKEVLGLSKEQIYHAAYEIDCMELFHDELTEYPENIDDDVKIHLLAFNGNLLNELFEHYEWDDALMQHEDDAMFKAMNQIVEEVKNEAANSNNTNNTKGNEGNTK